MLSWTDRVRELQEYSDEHGHVLVPKRCETNPSLGNWVNKQRQKYRRGELTDVQVAILNQLNFCWNAATSSDAAAAVRSTRYNSSGSSNSRQARNTQPSTVSASWWASFHELRDHLFNDTTTVDDADDVGAARNNTGMESLEWEPRGNHSTGQSTTTAKKTNISHRLHHHRAAAPPTRLGAWLAGQRRHRAALDAEQERALAGLDPDWHLGRRQYVWECRFRELTLYRRQHGGSCCVPISHRPNRALAHWVSTQRKMHNAGKLRPEHRARLERIGFVWNRWEHEFQQKNVLRAMDD
jgi:Helicase associated domain